MPGFILLLLGAAFAGEPNHFSLTAGGDVMLGRYRDETYREVGGDNPFTDITKYLNKADLTFVNLECPLMAGHPETMPKAPRGLVFRGSPERATQMAKAGIDVVSMANNHAEDLHMAGVEATEKILQEANITYFGIDSVGDPFAPVQVLSGDISVFFLGASTRRNLGESGRDRWIPSAYRNFKWLKSELPQRVSNLRADYPQAIILVSLHWGEEYVTYAPKAHQTLARKVIDSGANGVLGHHPHVLQPIEVYKGAPILYSMGNLVFDQTSLSRRRTGLFTMQWVQNPTGKWLLDSLEVLPVLLRGGHTGPTLANTEEAAPMMELMIKGAKAQNTILKSKDGKVHWIPNEEPKIEIESRPPLP